MGRFCRGKELLLLHHPIPAHTDSQEEVPNPATPQPWPAAQKSLSTPHRGPTPSLPGGMGGGGGEAREGELPSTGFSNLTKPFHIGGGGLHSPVRRSEYPFQKLPGVPGLLGE